MECELTKKKNKNLRDSVDKESSNRLARLKNEISFISILAVSLYLFISILSYSGEDPAWTTNGTKDEIGNLGGQFGAIFSDLALHAFGISAFLLPIILVMLAINLIRKNNSHGLLRSKLLKAIGSILTILSLCCFFFIHLDGGDLVHTYLKGGWIGLIFGNWLILIFGYAGSTVSVVIAFVAGISLALNISWFSVMDRVGETIFRTSTNILIKLNGFREKISNKNRKRARDEKISKISQTRSAKTPPKIQPKINNTKEGVRVQREKQTAIPLFIEEQSSNSDLPALTLLDQPADQLSGYSRETLEMMSRLVEKKLKDFNVDVIVVSVQPGPVITRFEIDPAAGVKASQIVGLSRDLARALSVVSVRVVENIPGKTYIGLEIPNETRESVFLFEGLASEVYENQKSPLSLILGKDIAGEAIVSDLCKMPHLLIAGTTGSGKSVCVNAIILSIIYKSKPEEVRMIMVDPKMLELSAYDGIPHLLTPVVTDMQKASNALRWCIVEMDRRFRLMASLGVRNIVGYNKKVTAGIEAGRPLLDPLFEPNDLNGSDAPPLEKIPYIVVIVDEFADLMMVVGKKIEELITRIAQRARAAGIHLVLATQRPSVDVVTGLIKANIPTRIAFQVSSRADSRTVLDQMGAEQLLGHGDMLFLPPGTGFPIRVHGSFVSDAEVHRVASQLKSNGSPNYIDAVINGSAGTSDFNESEGVGEGGEDDPLYDRAVAFVLESQKASISSVQRHLRVGYNRAARMIESMEAAGAVGPLENGKRQILVGTHNDDND